MSRDDGLPSRELVGSWSTCTRTQPMSLSTEIRSGPLPYRPHAP